MKDFWCEELKKWIPEIRNGHMEYPDMIWGAAEIVEPEKFVLELVINPDEDEGSKPVFEYHILSWDEERKEFWHEDSERIDRECKVNFHADDWYKQLEKEMTEIAKEIERSEAK